MLCGAVCVGTVDWTEVWGAGGGYAEFGTEEHGVCDMDGVYVFGSCDGIGRGILFDMA